MTLVAEDMVWRMPGTVPHHSGTYRGPSGVAGFFRELNASVRIESCAPREFIAEADCVLVTGWSWLGEEHRWHIRESLGHGFNVRDGKITYDVLQVDELPLPKPGEGEIRLRVRAIGLNRAESHLATS